MSGIRGQGCGTSIKNGLCGESGLCIPCYDKAESVEAIRAVEAQCDPHWREVARWAIEEYERQCARERA